MPTTTTHAEDQLRRRATQAGLLLRKYRTRVAQSPDYGNYYVVDPFLNAIVSAERLSLDEVDDFLAARATPD